MQLPGHFDAVSLSARAICALILGCPDNHMQLANTEGTQRIVKALRALTNANAVASNGTHDLDGAYGDMAALCVALCKCAALRLPAAAMHATPVTRVRCRERMLTFACAMLAQSSRMRA